MKRFLLSVCLLGCVNAFSQGVSGSLEKAWERFTGDVQHKHAMSSLHVINAKTGAVVFSRNAQTGLAPASTQKIITTVSALDILGSDFRYETQVGYTGKIHAGRLEGDLIISAGGDPTFGSWRWDITKMESVYKAIAAGLKRSGIKEISGELRVDKKESETQEIPDGWIWQDIGNYYGAGAGLMVWHENQYDLFLHSGKRVGDPVAIAGTDPELYALTFHSELKAAAAGTGDNAYIYLPVGNATAVVRGTIPVNEQRFRISGAMTDPGKEFLSGLRNALAGEGFVFHPADGGIKASAAAAEGYTQLLVHRSPTLDSIVYWFNKRSINLYGEALVKTISRREKGYHRLDSGLAVITRFWKDRGIDEDALNMRDGSGLSPLNRVTTDAQVRILQYARSRDWFPAFFHALPEYNGMKMKSGTISDVKGFCGYHKSKDGTEYIFSFLVNNYSGRAPALVGKMYKVLDELK